MDKGYLVAKIPNHFFLTCCYCFHFAFKMCLLLIPLGAAKTRRTFPVRFDKRLTFISVSPVPTPPIRPPSHCMVIPPNPLIHHWITEPQQIKGAFQPHSSRFCASVCQSIWSALIDTFCMSWSGGTQGQGVGARRDTKKTNAHPVQTLWSRPPKNGKKGNRNKKL